MKNRVLLLICTAISAGCVSVPSLSPTCDTPTGIDLLPQSGIVVFGEIHGTTEAPKFVSRVACASAQAGKRVIVAIEWPSDLQARLNDFFIDRASNPNAIRRADFVATNEDGRASNAMLSLIDDAVSMRLSGHSVSVVAFDVDGSSKLNADETRDRAMAKNLRAIVSQNSDALILVLTGNIHSRQERGTPWNAEVEPMAFLLRDLKPISLNVAHEDGLAWVCGGDAKCGPRQFKGAARFLDLTPKSAMMAIDSRVEAHDGYFYVGKLTASAPVR